MTRSARAYVRRNHGNSTLLQACRFAFGKKTQAKKTQAKSKLKQKTPKKLKKIIEKLNLPEIFDPILNSISL